MKNFLAVIFILVSYVQTYTQSKSDSIRYEIDKQVWQPFHDAFENLNATALNNTYGKDVIRVTPAGLDTRELFIQNNVNRFNKNKAEGVKIELDFWFESRDTDTTTSYEVGFFRITSTDAGGNAQTHYGQFHIVLKLMDGQWKIVQDYDTPQLNGRKITAEDYGRKPSQF